MNWYRLELGTKVYECFERVTKCGEGDCRKAPAAPKSLSPLYLPDAGLSVLRRVWAQLCPRVAERRGAGVALSRVPEGLVFSCRLR